MPKRGRGAADVDGHIEYFALDDTDQFALRLANLIMQSAQNVLGRAGMVVLNEGYVPADCGFKFGLVKAFVKEAPLVAKYLGFEQDDVGDGKRCSFHQKTFSLRIRIKYCP